MILAFFLPFYLQAELFFTHETPAAIWRKGRMEIYDNDAMQQFVNKYERDRIDLKEKGITIPSFDSYLLEQ